MPSDLSGLDAFISGFPQALKTYAADIADFGEGYLYHHDVWDDGEGLVDTGSLRASITGYADDNDAFKNFNDPDWLRARLEGNVHGRRAIQTRIGDRNGFHYNPPENYDPIEPETIYTDANATAVVTAWVRYGQDEPIEAEVVSAFMDTLNRMARYAIGVSSYRAFRDIGKVELGLFTKLNAPQNPNRG
jgi:hypothetical protein